ncbi:MAG TPA: cellulose binding domain-containing protein [Ktedonobacteraceae bacterium]|nr:cellulose binding domain-containing protein [Ktedonobacteraceae bacterium]
MQRTHGSPLFILVLVLALLLTSVASIFSLTTPARAAVSVAGLHVSGNQLLNGSGQVIRPVGVDRAGTEYECDASGNTNVFDGPTDITAINAMLSWDITAVRLPLNEDCWLGINGYPAGAYTASWYQQTIVNFVNTLTSYNVIVILDLHWNNSGTNQSNSQEPMPDLDHAPAFWTSVANTFKGNSSVIFDLYNEPYTKSWSCWLNGSTAAGASPCTDVPFAVAGMQTLVNTVRATGATNPIMLGGLAYANDMSQWLQYEPTDPDHNLIASTHIYNFNACNTVSCWASGIGTIASQVPVIAGEIGENDCADGFITTLMNWLDQQKIGYLAWAWDTYGCSSFPALISNYNGTPTAYGAGFKSHLAALGLGGGAITPTPSAPGVTITYQSSQWTGGFTANVTITNAGTVSYDGWTLQFTFPGDQHITTMWNGSYTQTGETVTITNVSYNGTIAGGQSISFGFQGTWTSNDTSPTTFLFNGASVS